MIEEVFYNLINEAEDGKVIIDDDELPIGFNTIIMDSSDVVTDLDNDNNLSKLVIKDKDKFFDLLSCYIEKELLSNRTFNYMDDKVKWIMTYLFTNATTEDFINPNNFLRKRIAFLEDDTFSYLDNGIHLDIGDNFLGSNLLIKNIRQSIKMETPYKLEVSLVNGEDIYPLPTISYGIDNDTCYIYSIMQPKIKEEGTYQKKIKRMLYKLNEGVRDNEDSEYLDYINNKSSYYPESNISDVSPSFLVSLDVMLSLLQKEKIKNVKGVPYLPIRYLSRDIASNNVSDENKKQLLQERNDRIQYNITNKFIRTLRRISYHMPDFSLISLPYENSECVEFRLNDRNENINNPILEDIANSVYSLSKDKTK